jgi:DNA-binding MarR family transcriptional regulator
VKAGLISQQHQALLAIKGYPEADNVSVQGLAERLCVRHHSAVELVDRLAEAGVCRRAGPTSVLLRLLPLAERRLARLSATHLEELRRLGPALRRILDLVGQPVSDRTAT